MADASEQQLVETVRAALEFAGLDEQELRGLIEASTVRSLRPDEILFEKGSAPDALFLVLTGGLGIVDVLHGEERELAMIRAGDLTGEVSLALNTARTRSAKAVEDTDVLVVPADVIEKLSAEHPSLRSRLIEAFEERGARREEAAAEEG